MGETKARWGAALGCTATAVAVIAVGTVVASADAATTATWDRLAHCESGGRWNVNTGNGYYGGLQFSGGTWKAYGGRKFAKRADLATKAEQIVVAERLLADRGWSPWPACSRKLGLSREDALGTPDVLLPDTPLPVPSRPPTRRPKPTWTPGPVWTVGPQWTPGAVFTAGPDAEMAPGTVPGEPNARRFSRDPGGRP
ncbi:MAG: transglycosylase family protein [Sporichthyaceae bacterium]